MNKSHVLLAAVALMLAACGSSVKLDPPVIGPAGGTATGQDGATGFGTDQGLVTEVQVQDSEAEGAGPANTERVIFFDYDSFVVKSEFQPVVDVHARFLRDDRSRSVVLEGHTDERGSREYNLALGQKRAEAVRRALTLVGAQDSQLEAVSFGEEKPAAFGTTEQDHALNRRVELRYR